MKRVLLFTSFFCLVSAYGFATLLRVNNSGNCTGSNCFPNAQAAHDAANNGDTLLFESSPASYGNLACTKRLTLIGNGYFLGTAISNGNPGLQHHTAPLKARHPYLSCWCRQHNYHRYELS